MTDHQPSKVEASPGAFDLSDPRLRMPFDQYQRYRTAADLVTALRPSPARVLEIGGAPGPIEAFLPGYEVVVSDVVTGREGRYVAADGTSLPFPDQSFDVVVTLDTLEHVPGSSRPALLDEMRRVSRDLVVLCAPFARPAVELAEEALLAFVQMRYGTTFETLQEHRDNELPVVEETVGLLSSEGWCVETLPSGYLPRWLLGMIFHHELAAVGLPTIEELHAYYNATVSPLDCRSPSYRQILLTGRNRGREELRTALDELAADGDEDAARATLAAIASGVLAQRMPMLQNASFVNRIAALEAERGGLDDHRENLEHEVRDLHQQVRALRQEIADRDVRIADMSAMNERLSEMNERLSERLGNRVFSSVKALLGRSNGA